MPSAQHSGSTHSHHAAANKQNSQKTISELFATSKQGLKERPVEDLPGASPSKRLKRNHLTTEPYIDQPSPKTKRAAEMYSFANPSRGASEVIDLTVSPNCSPMRKKTNGVVRATNFTPQAGPRKLVVTNLKRTSRPDPDEYYNHVERQVDEALQAIFQEEKMPYSMEELYKGVETACRQDRAPSLYKKLCDKCEVHMMKQMKAPLEQSVGMDTAVEVLRAVVGTWAKWKKHLDIIRSIFFYLDRSYLLHSAELPSINETGNNGFRAHIMLDQELRPKTLQGACDLISADRHGKSSSADRELLKNAIQMFHLLGVYTKDFEPQLMGQSAEFYESWAQNEESKQDLAGYVEQCNKLIAQERSQCDVFGLDPTTKKQMQNYLEDILVREREARLLLKDDVGNLLSMDHTGHVQQLFSLLQRKSLGEKLKPAFEAYINKQGSAIVFDEEREQDMVIRLLEFKRKLDLIWEHSFQHNEALGHSLREAFESFINKSQRSNMTWGTDNPKPGEMIAKYVDMVLKGGSKAIRASTVVQDCANKAAGGGQEESEEDEDVGINKQLDQVLDLFRFVHGKAVFEAFYKRDLARRLLLGRSANADAEKSMLTRLKSECGAGFTHNLEQMFKDIEMAREEISSYKAILEERDTRPVFDLSVNVLSSSAWPSYPHVTVNVPENILKATASFEQHYKLKHSGRKLEWKHALAHCQLKASFPKGNKEVVVSSFQAIVLLLFNNVESMTYSELQAASGLDGVELKRTLQSLACATYKVLKKNPKGRDVNTSDSFAVNLGFEHPKYRIKINQIQAKETKAENQQTHERVAADRNYETQAAVVRIMKSRKKITHAELVSEVIIATKSRGVLDPVDIKRNIEKLIDKDYMERDDSEDSRNVYLYVA